MLRSLKELEKYTVTATDGDVGKVVNFLFDDEGWAVRHLVVQTGGFFNERYVLISPISFREIDWAAQSFHVALTKDKIKNAPGIDSDRPVSRQHEQDYYRYYGYPHYWGYMGPWGNGCYPALLRSGPASSTLKEQAADQDLGDSHLRSAKEVRGYGIQGSDGAIGFVEDFIVDDETWEVRYLVVDTSHWWWGQRVLVAPRWTSQVSWTQRKVFANLSREAIKNGPSWDPNSVIRREYEARLHDYYGLRGYWVQATKDAGPHLEQEGHPRG
jgi:sporulation protein YlmC with PRC-barrel domain